jgi:hypothetical protein
MAVALESEKIGALSYFRGIDHKKLFEDGDFKTVCAYEKSSDEIRFVLQNTRIGSPNEEELIFVKLAGSNGDGLPVDAMKSGYPIKLEDLEVEKVSFIRSKVLVTVSSIKVGAFKLSTGNKIELI